MQPLLCGNARHTTAMYPDQGHSIAAAAGYSVADGGEKIVSISYSVNKCSVDVVPVRVCPSGKKDNSIQMYAIADEQSSKTIFRCFRYR